MSFIRHKKIYRHDVQGEAEHRSSFPSDHRCDESSAGYSFVGCSPAAPTSASPAVPSFSLYSAAVQFSAANRNCPSIALSQPRGPLQSVPETLSPKLPRRLALSTHTSLRGLQILSLTRMNKVWWQLPGLPATLGSPGAPRSEARGGITLPSIPRCRHQPALP